MITSIAGLSSLTSEGFRAGLRQLVNRAKALIRATSHRRAVRQLLDLDDRALKDIGLTRDDVARALGTPIDSDPSVVLIVRAVDHRSRLRRVASPVGRVAAREAALGNSR
ncbi:MAG: hypothetical protein JWR08_1056 [Enterovirga sp.]|nr:hypothetical protein [Enterovirga sp.]